MTPTVPAELSDLIVRIVGVEPELVTWEAGFADLGRSSADELEMLVAIEEQYRITLDFGDYLNMETVGALAGAIADVRGVSPLAGNRKPR
jgi:acyl carrier protein